MTLDLNVVQGFLNTGGPALWVIAALSVLTLAIILWKLWRLTLAGVWSGARAERLVEAKRAGRSFPGGRDLRTRFARATMSALDLPDTLAREEITRVAQKELAGLRSGLRPLDLIVTIAPLIGLLGTVLGMIAAFQALQATGGQADPSILAGGIWEALLTTAAGMSVAIPASVALSWFEGVAEKVQLDFEDIATRLVAAHRAEAA